MEATTKAFSYGTPARVRGFARGRASECSDAGYVAEAVKASLATEDEIGPDGGRVVQVGRVARGVLRPHLVSNGRSPTGPTRVIVGGVTH